MTTPFTRVTVDYAIRGTARVSWSLESRFYEPEPWSFQLQVAEADILDDNTIWTNVGSPVVGGYEKTDTEARAYGKKQDVYYRVVLTTNIANVYNSPSATVLGNIGEHQWNIYQELVRKEDLRLRRLEVGIEGYLLRRKQSGTPCPACTNPFTDEQTDSQCPTCFGTRFEGGYYAAQSSVYADPGLFGNEHRVDLQARGSTNIPTKAKARFLASPDINTFDIWVNKSTDVRYNIRGANAIGAVQGLPVSHEVLLELIPFDSVVYSFSLG